MCLYWFSKPNPVFETKSPICQSPYRAHINNIPDKIVVEAFFNISCNLRVITPVQYTVYSFIRYLVGSENAAITKNTPCHVQLYIRTKVMFLKCPSLKLITG